VFKPTPIDQLRLPHPDQERIDADSARLLRETARRRLDHISRLPVFAPVARPREKQPAA
jgi:hypothetical protein